jgi:hypothetical protein
VEPASPALTDAVSGDNMPAELLAAFVEVMLESSRPASRDDDSSPLAH